MADDKGNPLSGITNLFQGTTSSKTADKTLTEVQGVSNSVKSIDEQLNTIIELLTGISSNAAESLSSNAADAIKKATGGKAEIVGDKNSKENSEDESGGGEEDDKKTSKVASVKPNDLANLSAKYSLGPILIWSKLDEIDRKSTRLNSSHQIISYAGFCLKKKTAKYSGPFNERCRLVVGKYQIGGGSG